MVSAVVLGACAGEPATGPGGAAYVAATKPQTQSAITLTNLVVTPTTLSIGTPNAGEYTVTITNNKGKLALAVLAGYIQQTRTSDGIYVTQGAGGTNVQCGGASGVLPHGTCQGGFSINFGQTPIVEPGSATFHLELVDVNGLMLASADAPITLTQ